MLVHISELIKDMGPIVVRGERIMKAAKHNSCPRCKRNQVELVQSRKVAKWKCRCCKHKWVWEPITLIRSDSN